MYKLIPLLVLLTGCSMTGQHFTKFNPDGTINHELHLRHYTLFMDSKAATLRSETQTEDFIHTLNAEGIGLMVNTNALKAITEAVVSTVLKSQGIP